MDSGLARYRSVSEALRCTGEVQQELFLDIGLARYCSVSEALRCTGEVQQVLFWDYGLARYSSVSEALRCTGEVQQELSLSVSVRSNIRQSQIHHAYVRVAATLPSELGMKNADSRGRQEDER